MTEKQLLELMRGIPEEYILDAAPKPRRGAKRALITAAAVICTLAVLCGAIFAPALFPKYAEPYLYAEDAEKLFGATLDSGGATNAYKKVLMSETSPVFSKPLPTEAYVFRDNDLTKELSAEELMGFADSILPQLLPAFNIQPDELIKNEHMTIYGDQLLTTYYVMKNDKKYINLHFDQTGNLQRYRKTCTNTFGLSFYDAPLVLDGKIVQIDQRQSEEEMLASLEWVRDRLFEIFGQTFDSVKVEYSYSANPKSPISNIWVYYYNESKYHDMGDYISLYFTTSQSEDPSSDFIAGCSILYTKCRIPIEEQYTTEARVKLISLEKAEEHLRRGYVFGGHTCPICMSQQEKIVFDEYDYVTFEYLTDYYSDTQRTLPFYAFYKKLEDKENGTATYAKTYVCAIELIGLEEYFAKQAQEHE